MPLNMTPLDDIPQMITISKCLTYYIAGIPNLRGEVSVISWVHLYQWGDAIDVSY